LNSGSSYWSSGVKNILIKRSSPYSPRKIKIISCISNQIHILSKLSKERSDKINCGSLCTWIDKTCLNSNKRRVLLISLFKNNAIYFSCTPLNCTRKLPISISSIHISYICELSTLYSSIEYYSIWTACLE